MGCFCSIGDRMEEPTFARCGHVCVAGEFRSLTGDERFLAFGDRHHQQITACVTLAVDQSLAIPDRNGLRTSSRVTPWAAMWCVRRGQSSMHNKPCAESLSGTPAARRDRAAGDGG